MEFGLHSAASTEHTKTSLWACSVFPWFSPSTPNFLKASPAETPLVSISDCPHRVYLWGRGYEAGPALAAPGLSLLAVAGLVRRVQCREDLLFLSSEQFHGSRFLSPGHHYPVSILWLWYNAGHENHQRIITDHSNTFCIVNMASEKAKQISNS